MLALCSRELLVWSEWLSVTYLPSSWPSIVLHDTEVACNHRIEFSVDDPAGQLMTGLVSQPAVAACIQRLQSLSKLPTKHARTDTKSHRAIE
jgi:hypothetical protein